MLSLGEFVCDWFFLTEHSKSRGELSTTMSKRGGKLELGSPFVKNKYMPHRRILPFARADWVVQVNEVLPTELITPP